MEDWPADEEWGPLLPRWFVEASPAPKSEEEGRQYLAWWYGLSYEERSRVAQEEAEAGKWSVPDFLYPFKRGPDERQWRWWDATVSPTPSG